ncbi:MAG: hypothetical protein IJB70_12045 [Clostridia bacterium]|nr:hypothetical protein [Clostridia bacterium]
MSIQNSSDILKKIIKDAKNNSAYPSSITEEEIRNKISSIDRNAAMKKLRSMGLGSIADKVSNISDAQLIDIVSKNPALLKRINELLK